LCNECVLRWSQVVRDLAIITDQVLDRRVSAALAEDFSESDLPFKVDLAN